MALQEPGRDGRSEEAAGALLAVLAYAFWGVAPLYFHWVEYAGAMQVLTHRILWTAVFMVPLVLWMQGVSGLRDVLGQRRTMFVLLGTSALMAVNWGTFIHAVQSARLLEASLGYFINPLVTLLLGVIFLRERLSPVQWIALALATAGVANEVARFGSVPWIGLILAFSFGFYGLLRKQAGVDAFSGLTVESWLLAPFALAWILWNAVSGGDVFLRSLTDAGLLMLAGPVTMFPLLCFSAAALRISLSLLGFLQYIAPILHFALAIFVLGEDFDSGQWWTFGPIWLALVLFSVSAWRESRRHAMHRAVA